MSKRIPSVLRRRGETRGLTRDASSGGLAALVGPTVAGITVTPQVALTFSAVFSAIQTISRDFASLRPGVYAEQRKGGSKLIRTHPAYKLLTREPNPAKPRSNSLRFRQAKMGHALGWGNGYSEILRDGGGWPIGLVAQNPGKTKVKETEKGELYYELEDGRKLPPESVFHLAGLGFDGVTGYSPIGMAREAVGLGKAAEQFGASLFGNGAIPKGMLKTPKRLGETAQKNLRSSINAVHQGSANGNQVMILEEGLDWINTQINPDDAQFLATRAFQVLEVARIFGIPPHKIGDYSQSHLANVEESNLDYLTTTLGSWLEAFEAEANLKLLSQAEQDAGLFIQHDMTRLLRGNSKARVEYYRGLRMLGAINADEIRTREGMNPIGKKRGGDKYLVQGAMVPLESAGMLALPKPGTPPPTHPADPDSEPKTDPAADPADDTDTPPSGQDAS